LGGGKSQGLMVFQVQIGGKRGERAGGERFERSRDEHEGGPQAIGRGKNGCQKEVVTLAFKGRVPEDR